MSTCNTGVQTAEACLDWAEWTHSPETPINTVFASWNGPGDWRLGRSAFLGYREAWRRGGIAVFSDGPANSGIRVRFDGQACRQLESEGRLRNWHELFARLLADQVRFNRLDIALDDRAGILAMASIRECVEGKLVVSPLRSRKLTANHTEAESGVTADFGSKCSHTQIQIYDKAAQLGLAGPWVRVELRVYQERADDLAHLVTEHGLGAVAGVLKRYLDFKQPGHHSQRERWASEPWWEEFLGECQRLRLATARAPTVPDSWRRWVERMLPRSLVRYEGIEGLGSVQLLIDKERARQEAVPARPTIALNYPTATLAEHVRASHAG